MPILGSGTHVPLEVWTQAVQRSLDTLQAMSAPVLFVEDSPILGVHTTDCLSRRAARAAVLPDVACVPHADVYAAWRAVKRATDAAVRRAGVPALDAMGPVCANGTCQLEQDTIVVWRDGGHVTEPFARSRAAAFEVALMPLLGALPVRAASPVEVEQ